MDLGLDGRVALVTGGSKGIGRGIAEALLREGATVAVASRSASDGDGLRGYAFDSDDPAAAAGVIATVTSDLGPVDVLVLNTGGPPPGADPLAFSDEQWAAAHRSLVITPMALLRAALPGMRERGWGRVVAVSSSAAREPLPGLQLSNVSRPGLLGALKLLARDAAADGVTLNAVLPGRIDTDRTRGAYGSIEQASQGIPAGRVGDVAEIADAAVFLCSARASYVTGQSLLVDGGLTQSW